MSDLNSCYISPRQFYPAMQPLSLSLVKSSS